MIVGGGAGGLEMVTQLAINWGARKSENHAGGQKSQPSVETIAARSGDWPLDEGGMLSHLAHARNHGFQFQLGSVMDIDREAKPSLLPSWP